MNHNHHIDFIFDEMLENIRKIKRRTILTEKLTKLK